MREEISLIEGLDRGLEHQDWLDVQLARLETTWGIELNETQDSLDDHTG